MFGIVRRKKPYIHSQWICPLMPFHSDTEAFYKAIEEEVATQEIPDITVERVDFREGGWLSGKRTYLRLLRERVAFDVCSAPFGKGWYFSVRAAELPRRITPTQFWISVAALLAYAGSCCYLFGPALAGIVIGSSLLFLVLVFIAARSWGSLDEAILYLPVFGIYYEKYFRRDTFDQQDRRHVFVEMVTTIVRAKIDEFCAAGGVDEAQITKVSNPDQILTEREQVKFGYKDGGGA
jgi:hypothetical protein